ncbi:VOC family protein [Nocardioides sp. zg-1308]|uniref:VOC family protein n=1 Tax=Nocardioides renjunii TaxID=3095075 RepID=A0ABU5KD99_9ACTN|nr:MULTISPECIES: VOC family protein [unclassified Nocardioides]MDZ5662931.1 VOC family protein [Nocardioides sp. S-58]NPD05303.1 VOC family protein [Nocardioides sp. zg-1308]WQQ23191.1 VOC family protein [Nocardioides sp. S-34]
MASRPAPFHIAPVIAVTDLDRARSFYEDQLGLEGSPAPGGGWVLAGDHGTVLNLLPDVADAGSASWPVATIRVDDVHATVRTLRERGVSFLGPDDLPFDLDDDLVSVGQDGLAVAWMRDPDGSVLTVFSS